MAVSVEESGAVHGVVGADCPPEKVAVLGQGVAVSVSSPATAVVIWQGVTVTAWARYMAAGLG